MDFLFLNHEYRMKGFFCFCFLYTSNVALHNSVSPIL